MRFAWCVNLDAELELASARYAPQRRVLEQLARYEHGARRLLGPGDVWVEPGVRLEAPQRFFGRAWCPTPRAVATLEAAGITPEPYPSVDVLRAVNHRRFACELGGGLPGQRYCESAAELDAALRDLPRPCLLKRPLAFAGRGQLRVYDTPSAPGAPLPDPAQAAWVRASLAKDGLVIEPFVTPTLELSLHGFLWPEGHYELGHPCVQTVSERGVFRDARRAEPGELSVPEERALYDAGERVARALADAAYFGPFGIDAYRYTGEHGVGFCALGEINARYTMGFVVGFSRPPSELELPRR